MLDSSWSRRSGGIFPVGVFLALLFPWAPSHAAEGQIVGWGGEVVGVDLDSGFVAVAAGGGHSLGLKEDGSIVAWGGNGYGQCNVPSPNTGFVAVAAGWAHSLGLKQDGSIVAWGSNEYRQCDAPSPNSGFVAIAAGWNRSLAVRGQPPSRKPFRRGDADDDGRLSISDAVFVLGRLFLGGTNPNCLEAANADDDASLNITDAIYLLNHLFPGGPAPPPPGPDACGLDPQDSASDLGCEMYRNC